MPIDIIKSDVIGQIPQKEQQYYTDKWEDLEVQTSRSGFNDVFTHTRMIFAKSKAKKSLLEEFKESVLSKTTPKQLINDILEPYSEAYTILVNRKYVAIKNTEHFSQNYQMQAVKNDTQKPSALYLRIDDLNTDKYNRAKRVLDIFDGRTPVIFYLTDTKRKVKAPSSMWVDINPVMIKELKYQLGDENVVAK